MDDPVDVMKHLMNKADEQVSAAKEVLNRDGDMHRALVHASLANYYAARIQIVVSAADAQLAQARTPGW